MKNKAKEILSKAWLGQFVNYYEIGEYSFVEYKPTSFDGVSPKVPRQYEEQSNFSPFINGKDISCSYASLDEAIIGAIAVKYDGGNTRADRYFMKAIKPDNQS